jgi:hypothetical protein
MENGEGRVESGKFESSNLKSQNEIRGKGRIWPQRRGDTESKEREESQSSYLKFQTLDSG